MQNVKNTMLDRLLNMLAPHPCCYCGTLGGLLCNNCKYDIIRTKFRACIVCGESTDTGVCSSHRVFYQKAWVVGLRRAALRELTGAFKFKFRRAALPELAGLLHTSIPPLPSNTVVVPVPTRPAHVRVRGYDHAWLLASAFARIRGYACQKLVRKLGNSVQHQLTRQARLVAARKGFVATTLLPPDVPYLIVDDIITTGATVAAMAEALHRAGARTIWVAAVAYQSLD